MIYKFGGGLNENPEPHILEAMDGYNFDLQKSQTKLRPRRPFDLKGTTTNAGIIRGLLQLVTEDGTETTLVQSGPVIYEWDGTTFTSTATVATTSQLRDVYWALDEYLVITDIQKATVVSSWDGTTFAPLTTGLGNDLYAKYAVVHLGRVWLFNVTTTIDTPHLMVASAFEDPELYSTTLRATTSSFITGGEAFYMLSPDLKPINGVALFQDQLIISTEGGRIFRLTGTSPTDFAWKDFYGGSSAIGEESMVNAGNDVLYMRRGGAIESLVATDRFGDVSADDVSRWIPTTIANQTGALAVYDQSLQKVMFFVPGKVLVFFKDIVGEGIGGATGISPWSVYRTDHASQFNTLAVRYMRRPGTEAMSVYWGDDSGNIFDLNGTGEGDAGTRDIPLLRKSRLLDEQIIQPWPYERKNVNGSVQYSRLGECQVTISYDWADEYNTADCTITLKGPPPGETIPMFNANGYFGGSTYFNQGFAFAQKVSHRSFSPIGKGPGFFQTVSSSNKIRYEIDHIKIT